MKLVELRIAGFGRLSDRTFMFEPGLNVIFGPNESGKSTVASAIVATLYGVERRKDFWRPWEGDAYGTALIYDLQSGERVEIQRDYTRDAKGLRAFDRNGRDLSAEMGAGRRFVPGEAHLGIPLDVFVNAACVRQQFIAIDDTKDAGNIAAHLARALDGGPREDAAIGALKRLDDALRTHVGTERARKNAPLRALRETAEQQRASVDEARGKLEALDGLRERIERAASDRDRLASALAASEHRARALRAGAIAGRLAALREFREELAELQAARAAYDDVAAFAAEREAEAHDAFVRWELAEGATLLAAADAGAASLPPADERDLETLRRDVGTLDDDAFAALAQAAAQGDAARNMASAAASEAAAARRLGGGGAQGLGALLAVGGAMFLIAVSFAIAHWWELAATALVVSAIVLTIAFSQGRSRAGRRREADRKQKVADDALAAEHLAASVVAAVLEPLGLPSFDEVARRRERLTELEARAATAARLAERAHTAREDADARAARFDAIARELVPDITGDRAGLHAAIAVRSARKRERLGIEAHLNALEMRKSTILGSDDEFALEAELEALARAGVSSETGEEPSALRLIEAERTEYAEHLRAAEQMLSHLQGELESAEAHIADLAALDESLGHTRLEITRLEAFERAVSLARDIIDTRMTEEHQKFARRLENYAAQTLDTITGGRYGEIFVDPQTLAIQVRVPETRNRVGLDALSAGTRDQAYLVVRFAMARMFAEGLETPPLLLDDPFAYWDAERIERCLPIVEAGMPAAQTLLFTSSEDLAGAAVARGAHRIDLSASNESTPARGRRPTPTPA